MSLAVIAAVAGAVAGLVGPLVLFALAAGMRREARELRARNRATAEAILAELNEWE